MEKRPLGPPFDATPGRAAMFARHPDRACRRVTYSIILYKFAPSPCQIWPHPILLENMPRDMPHFAQTTTVDQLVPRAPARRAASNSINSNRQCYPTNIRGREDTLFIFGGVAMVRSLQLRRQRSAVVREPSSRLELRPQFLEG